MVFKTQIIFRKAASTIRIVAGKSANNVFVSALTLVSECEISKQKWSKQNNLKVYSLLALTNTDHDY